MCYMQKLLENFNFKFYKTKSGEQYLYGGVYKERDDVNGLEAASCCATNCHKIRVPIHKNTRTQTGTSKNKVSGTKNVTKLISVGQSFLKVS